MFHVKAKSVRHSLSWGTPGAADAVLQKLWRLWIKLGETSWPLNYFKLWPPRNFWAVPERPPLSLPGGLGASDSRCLERIWFSCPGILLELKLMPLKITAKQQVLQAVITTELLFAIVDSCQDRISIFWEIFQINLRSGTFWTCGSTDLLV